MKTLTKKLKTALEEACAPEIGRMEREALDHFTAKSLYPEITGKKIGTEEGALLVRGVSYRGPRGVGIALEFRYTDKAGELHVKVQQIGPELDREHDWVRVTAPGPVTTSLTQKLKSGAANLMAGLSRKKKTDTTA
jgi:hypothetical protein